MGIEIPSPLHTPSPSSWYSRERKTKVCLSLRLKQKSRVSGQLLWKLPPAAARSSAASPTPPQPWKAALASSLPSSAGMFLGKTCKVKQHARTSPVHREAGRTHLPKQRHTTRCQGKTQANQQGSVDPVKRHVWVRASPLDLATPQLHQGCLHAPREPQAVPVPFQVQPLIEVSRKPLASGSGFG